MRECFRQPLLVAVALTVACGDRVEECPEDYTLARFAEDYSQAICDFYDQCGASARTRGLTHDECLLVMSEQVFSEAAYCESNGGTVVDVCAEWDCIDAARAAADSTCELYVGCGSGSMYDPPSCTDVD